MLETKIKRAFWALNEFIDAPPRGISIEEFIRKWEQSSMNDEPDKVITPRTFHRIRRSVESVFDVEIECVKGAEPRYRISSEVETPGIDSMFSLMLNKMISTDTDKSSSVTDIYNLIMSGSDIPKKDMEDIKAIASRLRQVPYDSGMNLIQSVHDGEIPNADSADWDEDYRGYVCVWNDADYNRTDLWVSIGIYNDKVLVYVVTSIQDAAYREMVAELLQVENGKKYRSDYWWYEPMDESLFKLDFQTFPDMAEVKRRAALLLSRIASLPADIKKPGE